MCNMFLDNLYGVIGDNYPNIPKLAKESSTFNAGYIYWRELSPDSAGVTYIKIMCALTIM